MSRFAHVLCPVDFSDVSQHALDHAAVIAHRDQARLTVLYVYATLPTMDLPPLVLSPAARQRIFDDLRKMCATVPPEVRLDLRVEEAEYVHQTILEERTALGADLLVVGTHGRSGFKHLFLGSVTEKLIRKSGCPTLVVPPRAPDAATGAPNRMSRVLCPIDFSGSSLNALAWARPIAADAGARLTLLSVVDIGHELRDSALLANVDVDALVRAAEADTRRRLAALAGTGESAADVVVAVGPAGREVLCRALQEQAGLIVMGVHGRGALDLGLFGSTTHHVIRESVCPVLIVPS
jgi:nucleotide-binding universal stress UspA family protein